MASHEHVTKCAPCENVVPVRSICVYQDEDHDETPHRGWLQPSNDLALAFERYLAEPRDVAKLPRRASAGLDLNRDVLPALV